MVAEQELGVTVCFHFVFIFDFGLDVALVISYIFAEIYVFQASIWGAHKTNICWQKDEEHCCRF